jgi:phosphatidylserine/phosphatidylglycerophosphate/cardiolipin synthase-like enzyme
LGYTSFGQLPHGISFAGGRCPAHVELLYDLTWVDDDGTRRSDQQVFDSMLDSISRARHLVLLDLFLFNDFQGVIAERFRDLAGELTAALIERKRACETLDVYFITDPINTIYGGVENPYLTQLRSAGIRVVITDLLPLRDSNPVYSFLWRLLIRPFGNSKRGILPAPFAKERISLRSYLAMLNLKANHRKTLIADDGADGWVAMIMSGNPHNGSSAHRNSAVRFRGAAVLDLFQTECAVLEMSGFAPPGVTIANLAVTSSTSLQVLTERKIKLAVSVLLQNSTAGDEIDIMMFYLSDRRTIGHLRAAADRGSRIRILLDPNKDAFGMKKMGIPNRPAALDLRAAGIELRWAHTHGEQSHDKMMLIRSGSGHASLLLGSANFTRRNLNDFNLETDALIQADRNEPLIRQASALFNRVWHNEPGRTYSVDYEYYADPGRIRYLLYWLMESTGISTF